MLDGVQPVVPTAAMRWEPIDGRRVAGVSAFGFSGTNAHVVIEEPDGTAEEPVAERPSYLITLSAKGETALREAAGRLATRLRGAPASIADVAFTLNRGRAHLAHRLAFAAATAQDADATLLAIAEGRWPDGVRHGVADNLERPEILFAFGRERTESTEMGRQLYDLQPVFRSGIDRCHEVLSAFASSDDAALAPVAVFMFEYALALLWQSWGLAPAAVTGQGVGEDVARCVAGVFTLEEGLKRAAARGRAPAAGGADVERTPPEIARAEPSIPVIEAGSSLDGIPAGVRIEIGPSSRGRGDWLPLLEALADVYMAGAKIDWAAFDAAGPGRRIPLPSYPFQRQRYWIDAEPRSTSARPSAFDAALAGGLRQSSEGPLDLAVHTYAAKWHRLGQLTDAYILKALRDLGAFRAAGERHDVNGLLRLCGIEPPYAPLVSAWLDRLASTGALRRDGDAFISSEPLPDSRIEEIQASASELSDAPAFAEYVKQHGDRLARVITGKESALEPLFPGSGFELTKAVYEDSAPARYINAVASAVVDEFVRARGTQSLRILEVAAGSGCATAALLRAVPPARTTYWVTDASDRVVESARQRFAWYDFVRYGVLDVDQDPEPQGYPANGFDIIVASRALSAGGDVQSTIGHLRRLLASGGLLLLHEPTVHHPWLDITTNLPRTSSHADGAWPEEPAPRTTDWTRVLVQGGFEAPAVLPPPESPAAVLGSAIVIARAPVVTAPSAVRADAPPRPVQNALLGHLREAAPAERDLLLVECVRGHVGDVLGLDASARPERRHRLMDLGLDSLMAVDLRNRLAASFDGAVTLPATLMFDFPTIDAIAAFIGRQLDASAPGGRAPAAAPGSTAASEAAARLAAVSEEEAEALLIQKLETL